jgi:hypothetical protein
MEKRILSAVVIITIIAFATPAESAKNLLIDVGNDTDYEWSAGHGFTGPQRLSIAGNVNRYVRGGCWCLGCHLDTDSGNCTVPIVFKSDITGNYSIDDIKLIYESDMTLAEVGYGTSFRKSQGGCWEIDGFSGPLTVPIPPEYNGGNCLGPDYTYKFGPHPPPKTDDAIVDATYRLLNDTLDTNQNGRLDPGDGFPDPAGMAFRADGKIGVQSIWGPVKMRLIVWA